MRRSIAFAVLPLVVLMALTACGRSYNTTGMSMEQVEQMAEEAWLSGDNTGASRLYTELMFMYPGATSTDLYLYRLGLAEAGLHYWADAIFYFSRVWTDFPRSEWADDASYQAARTWWLQKEDYRKDLTPVLNAALQIEAFRADFPGSSLMEEAELLEESINTHLSMRALFIGRFYTRRDKYDAAILYLREALNDYGETECKADVLIALAEVYTETGNLYSARRSYQRALDECVLNPDQLAEVTKALEEL